MKNSSILILFLFFTISSFCQTYSLLNTLHSDSSEQQELFPKKMLFTQRILWGENEIGRAHV